LRIASEAREISLVQSDKQACEAQTTAVKWTSKRRGSVTRGGMLVGEDPPSNRGILAQFVLIYVQGRAWTLTWRGYTSIWLHRLLSQFQASPPPFSLFQPPLSAASKLSFRRIDHTALG